MIDVPTGMLIYNVDAHALYMKRDTGWAIIATLAELALGGGGGGAHWSLNNSDIFNSNAGNVGIGTSFPTALFQVESVNGIVVFKGSLDVGADLIEAGQGSKFVWNPKRGALRAGYVDNVNWNHDYIGKFSVAMGYNTVATNDGTVSLGYNSVSSGQYGVSLGHNNTAAGVSSTAFGSQNTASGTNSVAIGNQVIADGTNSFAIGTRVTNNGFTGSFMLGDYNPITSLGNDAGNQMRMRFSGGYKLHTTSSILGVQLNAGDNAWSSISDMHRKENFKNVDGENFLAKISKLNLTSWNYKGQDPKTFRHYGPVAQEFHKAFGYDGIGTVGNDTTINQSDFNGINLIAIQALEKRTSELKVENESLKTINAKLEKTIALMEERLRKLEANKKD